MNIRTNHHFREIEYDDDGNAGFHYKGEFYRLDDFIRMDHKHDFPFDPDGIHALTVWSGLVIKLSDDGEAVKVYYYWS